VFFKRGLFSSVLHLTASGGNMRSYGDRNPLVMFPPKKTNQLYVCSSINGKKSDCTSEAKTQIPLKEWSSVRIKQKMNSTGFHLFSITVNGVTVVEKVNRDARNFSDVEMYVGDPWYSAHVGYIRNLRIGVGSVVPVTPAETKSNGVTIIIVVVVILLIILVVTALAFLRLRGYCKSHYKKTPKNLSQHNTVIVDPGHIVNQDSGERGDAESENPYYGQCGDTEYACITPFMSAQPNESHEYTYINPNNATTSRGNTTENQERSSSQSPGTSQMKFKNLHLDTEDGQFAHYVAVGEEGGEHMYKQPSGVVRHPQPSNETTTTKGSESSALYEDPGPCDAVYDDPTTHGAQDYETLRDTQAGHDYDALAIGEEYEVLNEDGAERNVNNDVYEQLVTN